MKTTYVECDECQKRTDDYYRPKGWAVIDWQKTDEQVVVFGDRKELHLCPDCIVKLWVPAEVKEKRAKWFGIL